MTFNTEHTELTEKIFSVGSVCSVLQLIGGGFDGAYELVRRQSGTSDRPGTTRQARVVHQGAGRRRRVEKRAERPGAAAGGRDEEGRSGAERRFALEGDGGARRADRVQRDAAAPRAADRARSHGVRRRLNRATTESGLVTTDSRLVTTDYSNTRP